MAVDPFYTMGVQYKSFDPEYAQVYGMYHKEEQVIVEEEYRLSPSASKFPDHSEEEMKFKEQTPAKPIKVPINTLLAPRATIAIKKDGKTPSPLAAQQQGNQSMEMEEKESEDDSSSTNSTTSTNLVPDVEITSNMAFDRFASLGAYGYSNGMIKLFRVYEAATEL